MSVINADAVKRLFASNGFTYSFGMSGSMFKYSMPGSNFSLEFSAPWLKVDPLAEYDLGEVRKMLTSMSESARAQQKVYDYLRDQDKVDMMTKCMTDFGMKYDADDACFYYVRNGSAVFGVDLDYIASLVCTGKITEQQIPDTLADMLETADYEAGVGKKIKSMEKGATL